MTGVAYMDCAGQERPVDHEPRTPDDTMTHLLSYANPKIAKGSALGVLTAVLHLLPAGEYDRLRVAGGRASSGTNLCPFAGTCRAPCLNTAGRGGLPMRSYSGTLYRNNVEMGRYRRTDRYVDDRAGFVVALPRDVKRLADMAAEHGLSPAARLNGTSDIDWEAVAPDVVADALAAGVRLYDYTKRPIRFNAAGKVHYTYSLDVGAARERHAVQYLNDGGNVAVVFATKRGQALPATWRGFPVFDADTTDVRYRDPAGHVAGLRAKGRAKGSTSGFVHSDVAT